MEEKEIYLDGTNISVATFIPSFEMESNTLDFEDTIDLTEIIKKASVKKRKKEDKKERDKNGNK